MQEKVVDYYFFLVISKCLIPILAKWQSEFLCCYLTLFWAFKTRRLEVLVLLEIKLKWLAWSFFLQMEITGWAAAERCARTGNCICFPLREKPLMHRGWSDSGVSVISVTRYVFSLLLGVCTQRYGVSWTLPGSAGCSAACWIFPADFFQRDLAFIKCWG